MRALASRRTRRGRPPCGSKPARGAGRPRVLDLRQTKRPHLPGNHSHPGDSAQTLCFGYLLMFLERRHEDRGPEPLALSEFRAASPTDMGT